MKYILVTGGVISGVGKGVIASSFGTLLNSCGIDVTSIKIDPYINIDAGTFSPYEHGEVYVLDDGGEVDLDLGNYERFLDVTLHRDNNITTGKIYKMVIENERVGEYLGKTVQVVPHITDAIQEWVERVAAQPVKGSAKPQVCVVELGGTIGDIEGMPFVEAFRQFQFRVKRENFCVAHVSLVPMPRATGEPKTKPTQSSVRELRGLGLSPDLIVCRSEKPIGQEVKEKISNFCHVAPEQVICIHDLSSIYHVPLLMESHGVIDFLSQRLQINIPSPRPNKFMHRWRDLARRVDTLRKEVTIALVGKYTKLEDSYASISKSLQHASLTVGYKLNLKYIEACNLEKTTKAFKPALYHEAWQSLCVSDGLIVPGGFGSRGIEGKIRACQWSRENNKPFLGICLGLQAAVIEFSRNVLNYETANSTEVDADTQHPVVIDMPEFHPVYKGASMRLGRRTTVFKEENSVIKTLYGNVKQIDERHRHRYEVNPKYVEELEAHGLKFVGTDTEKTRMEIIELENHPYFVATQFHPEYLSRPLKPSPPFLGLILASVGKLQNYLSHGCRLSPRQLTDESSGDEEDLFRNLSLYPKTKKEVTNKDILNETQLTNGVDSAIVADAEIPTEISSEEIDTEKNVKCQPSTKTIQEQRRLHSLKKRDNSSKHGGNFVNHNNYFPSERPHQFTLEDVLSILPQFHGECDENVNNFISALQHAKMLMNVDENVMIAALHQKIDDKDCKATFSHKNFDEILSALRNLFPVSSSCFEKRKWDADESFINYCHEKQILANGLNLCEKELIDYIIDGFVETDLKVLATLQNFTTIKEFVDAFQFVRSHKIPATNDNDSDHLKSE